MIWDRSFEQFLLKKGYLKEEQLASAKQQDEANHEGVLANLVKLGTAEERTYLDWLGEHLGISVVHLEDFPIQKEAVNILPQEMAKKRIALPIMKTKDMLTVAMANPLDIDAIEEIKNLANCPVEPVLASEALIRRVIDKTYGYMGQIEELIQSTEEAIRVTREKMKDSDKLDELISMEGPTAKAVNLLISQAAAMGASDIHMEPMEKNFRVRYRIDGVLREIKKFNKVLQSPFLSSTKIMAKMDIAEKRLPQDGRFSVSVDKREIDIRVSSFPCNYGEKIVMRLLDKQASILPLDDLGFSDQTLPRLKKVIYRPNGIFLVTGPTGSGKSTTLYAVLNDINDIEKNVVTLEDPIEYDIGGINQAQMNPKKGMTFAKGLRSILRQDPDIIMLGEIRDAETAEIAIQAALTGHFVLSTLHTNDSPGAIVRLVEMGIEPFLVSSAIQGILSQRLVRRLCKKCAEPYKPSEAMLESIGLPKDWDKSLYKAAGCWACNKSGYAGRVAIHELLVVSEEMRAFITTRRSGADIKKMAESEGMDSLWKDGIKKAVDGKTTIEEVLSIVAVE